MCISSLPRTGCICVRPSGVGTKCPDQRAESRVERSETLDLCADALFAAMSALPFFASEDAQPLTEKMITSFANLDPQRRQSEPDRFSSNELNLAHWPEGRSGRRVGRTPRRPTLRWWLRRRCVRRKRANVPAGSTLRVACEVARRSPGAHPEPTGRQCARRCLGPARPLDPTRPMIE